MGLTGISFGYDDTKVVDLTTTSPALSFYLPPVFNNNVASQGNKVMQLSNNALTFYNPSDGTTAYATLNANGLKLAKGGIQAGTANQSGFVYLSTDNYGNYSINNSSGISDWKQIIGTKFGVRADGTLYASNAVISGTIIIGAGSNVYTKTEADDAFDASGDAAAAQAAAIAAAATDATNKANAAQANAIAEIPTNISELTNDSGYQTSSEVSSAIGNATAGKADNSMAVYREQRIYRRYTSAQSNLSGPTTWITTNSDTYNGWTTKVPQLTNGSTKYPYLYTCIQKQTVAQYNNGSGTSCTCTEVLLDDTTTVIDGGSVIAGSITASEITGNKLSAIYADMGNITAGNITKGNNSINFDNSPATLEFKNASTWSAATQGIKYDSGGLAIKGAVTATSLTLGNGVQIPASTAISGLSTVATTGSYNDLSNKPTIPDLTNYIYKDGTIGSTPADGATGFKVSSSGLLTASNAIIYGSIYASKGYIGGWQIGTDGNKTLHNGSANTSPVPGSGVIVISKGVAGSTAATGVLPANKTWTITADNKFGVTTDGVLYASGVNISGAITASSLTISSGASVTDNTGLISNDAIEIGGRNLLRGTSDAISWEISLNSSNYGVKDCYKTYMPVPLAFVENDLVTISFDWETTATDGNFHVECGNVTPYTWGTVINAVGGRSATSNYVDITSSNTSGHFVVTFRITSNQISADEALQWLRIRIDGANTAGETFTISNAKAEKGNKATDWTPAPEDAVEEINDANNSMAEMDDKITNNFATKNELDDVLDLVTTYVGDDGYITMTTDGLEIGKGKYRVVLTATDMKFFEEQNPVASISGRELVINSSRVNNSMQMGNFLWTITSDQRLILKYIG